MIHNKALINLYSQEKLNDTLIYFYSLWKKRYLRTVENVSTQMEYLFYSLDQPTANNAVTVSEAMGYAAVIFPLMSRFDVDAKNHFIRTYNYIKNYPSVYNKNLMAWQQIKTPDGKIVNAEEKTDSATDGDMDISYGLLLAHKLWGKNDKISYKDEAIKRINDLLDSCVDKTDYIITLGDWVQGIPNSTFKNVTRSSDFMMHHLIEFGKANPAKTAQLRKVMDRINSIINDQLMRESKDTGLMPDFFIKSGDKYIAPKKKVLESSHDGDYFTNSCRTPWRYSMDILFNNYKVTKQMNTLNNWIRKTTSQAAKNIKSGYYIANGTPGSSFGTSDNLAFIAPFLVASLTEPGNDQWTLDIWKVLMEKPIEKCTFYENTLKLMAMIIATGNWFSPSSTEYVMKNRSQYNIHI
ncbi:glycosyl hydrolase family 8 [Inconstantimicrobium mannanitabidum]|uniref:Licheninase n=1 Tax=Inconstantimicrobium mannanitabidum TaxID=1604901 RepID=A0ACB5R6N5_9CLOT|nr:glycosyl hydrolase family 8 [Clostridium sp. TW13]GKX64872.1 licheninase [Clostridium sp. TW13]